MISDNLLMAVSLAIDGGIPTITQKEIFAAGGILGANKSLIKLELCEIITPIIKKEKKIVKKDGLGEIFCNISFSKKDFKKTIDKLILGEVKNG